VTEKVLHEVFDPYGVNEVSVLQEGTHVMAFVEFKSWREATIARDGLHGRCIYDNCCSLNIQYSSPSVIVSAPTPPIVVPTAATMTDQGLLLMATTPTVVRWRNQVVAASEVQVDDNLVAVTPTDCSVVGMCIDAGVQLSAFNREETMCAPVVIAELNGELKHDVELFSKEDYENVMTHIGGTSLFLEAGLKFATKMSAERPSNGMVLDVELADTVLTHVGGCSLFIEHDMTTQYTPVLRK
jgi:hypothetical protein